MGFIREQHGRITVESRRESFYVHAGYGFSVGRRPVESLDFVTDFVLDGQVWRVRSKHAGMVCAVERQFSTEREVANGTLVEVPGTEDFDEEAPLARQWRDHPHPEFAVEDLDDLIAALSEYRASMTEG